MGSEFNKQYGEWPTCSSQISKSKQKGILMNHNKLLEVCAHWVRPSDMVTWKDYSSILGHMTWSAETNHYGWLSRDDSGGRKREEGSKMTLRCMITEKQTGNTTKQIWYWSSPLSWCIHISIISHNLFSLA